MPRGYIAVEFFFLVSGYLMAKKLAKDTRFALPAEGNMGKGYIQFLWNKLSVLLPYHVIAFVMLWIVHGYYTWEGPKDAVSRFLTYIPSLFLVQKVGFDYSNLNSVEWYISAMMIAMAIIYPLARKNYSDYARIAAPLCAILILGWLFHDYGMVSEVEAWDVFGFRCVWRAIAEINLGIFAYECAEVLKRQEWKRGEKIFLMFLELAGWALTILFAMTKVSKKYEIYLIVLLFISVVLAFSEVTAGGKLFQNKIVYWLGKVSLPLYLTQLTAIEIVKYSMKQYVRTVQIIAVLLLTFLFAMVCMAIGDRLLKKLRESHFNQILSRKESVC
jgi:peptidoglycan/LPS O-acetylase OafA/YrhL